MTTHDKNQLEATYRNALQDFQDAKVKEEREFYPFELTCERVEADGFIQGYELGAVKGYRHAIALLQAEQFTEHAQILESQLTEITKIFEAGE